MTLLRCPLPTRTPSGSSGRVLKQREPTRRRRLQGDGATVARLHDDVIGFGAAPSSGPPCATNSFPSAADRTAVVLGDDTHDERGRAARWDGERGQELTAVGFGDARVRCWARQGARCRQNSTRAARGLRRCRLRFGLVTFHVTLPPASLSSTSPGNGRTIRWLLGALEADALGSLRQPKDGQGNSRSDRQAPDFGSTVWLSAPPSQRRRRPGWCYGSLRHIHRARPSCPTHRRRQPEIGAAFSRLWTAAAVNAAFEN